MKYYLKSEEIKIIEIKIINLIFTYVDKINKIFFPNQLRRNLIKIFVMDIKTVVRKCMI